MHYYQKNIADYRKDTGHLSLLEHGIYNQVIDTYYLDEKPIETQSVIRRLSIKTEEEKLAFQNVLNDFFKRSECGNFWVHKRIDEEISKYHSKAETAKANGRKGGRPKKPKKTQPVNLANPEKTGSKANHKPLTINHKPLTNSIYKKIDLSGLPQCISQKTAMGLIDHRIGKKSPLVQSSFDLLIKKSQKPNSLGYTPDQVISECMANGWTGIEIRWLENKQRCNHEINSSTDTGKRKSIDFEKSFIDDELISELERDYGARIN